MRLRWWNTDYYHEIYSQSTEYEKKILLPSIHVSALDVGSRQRISEWVHLGCMNSSTSVQVNGRKDLLQPTELSVRAAERLSSLLLPQKLELIQSGTGVLRSRACQDGNLFSPRCDRDCLGFSQTLEPLQLLEQNYKGPFLWNKEMLTNFYHLHEENDDSLKQWEVSMGLLPSHLEPPLHKALANSVSELLITLLVHDTRTLSPCDRYRSNRDDDSAPFLELQLPSDNIEEGTMDDFSSPAIETLGILKSCQLYDVSSSEVAAQLHDDVPSLIHKLFLPYFPHPKESDSIACIGALLREEKTVTDDGQRYISLEKPCPIDSSGLKPLSHSKTILNSLEKQEVTSDHLNSLASTAKLQSLIVAPDLTLDCFSFCHLPTPILSFDNPYGTLGSLAFSQLANSYTGCQLSASDALYLDWHMSQDNEDCHDDGCWHSRKRLQNESSAFVDIEVKHHLDMEKPGLICFLDFDQPSHDARPTPASALLPNKKSEARLDTGFISSSKTGSGAQSVALEEYINRRRSTLQGLGSSMLNELNFFLNTRRGGTVGSLENEAASDLAGFSNAHIDTGTATAPDEKDAAATNIFQHTINLSSEIQQVLEVVSDEYQVILASDCNLRRIGAPPFGVKHSGNAMLQSSVKKAAQANPLDRSLLRKLACLYVLRQTAYNCYEYGIRVSHLYLEHITQSMKFLRLFTAKTDKALQMSHEQVENGAIEDHPKLAALEGLLKETTGQICLNEVKPKILLVAERRAFFTMYRQLVALDLKPYQIDREEVFLKDGSFQGTNAECLNQAVSKALNFSSCLLVPPAYITQTFPMDKFSMIVFYNQDTYMYLPTAGKSKIHVLSVTPWKSTNQSSPECSVRQEIRKGQEILEEKKDKTPQSIKVSVVNNQEKSQQSGGNLQQVSLHDRKQTSLHTKQQSFSKRSYRATIIANIDNGQPSLLAQKREYYQKILEIEQHGIQIVEREIHVPVDFIISPAACLIVYSKEKLHMDEGRLQQQTSFAFNEAIDTIVDKHLKAIGFGHQECIMIFEGERTFTAGFLHSMDSLYAAAVGLDIYLQCFLSDSLMTTVQLVRGFLLAVRDNTKTLCPPVRESETLAEAFLNSFPGLNPLSSSAILGCGIPLPVYICLSAEQQLAATVKYGIPERCLLLFQAECQHRQQAPDEIVETENMGVDVLHSGQNIREGGHLAEGEGSYTDLNVGPFLDTPGGVAKYGERQEQHATRGHLPDPKSCAEARKHLSHLAYEGVPQVIHGNEHMRAENGHHLHAPEKNWNSSLTGEDHMSHNQWQSTEYRDSQEWNNLKSTMRDSVVQGFQPYDDARFGPHTNGLQDEQINAVYFPPAAEICGEPEPGPISPPPFPQTNPIEGYQEESWSFKDFETPKLVDHLSSDKLDDEFNNARNGIEFHDDHSVVGALDRWLATRRTEADSNKAPNIRVEQPFTEKIKAFQAQKKAPWSMVSENPLPSHLDDEDYHQTERVSPQRRPEEDFWSQKMSSSMTAQKRVSATPLALKMKQRRGLNSLPVKFDRFKHRKPSASPWQKKWKESVTGTSTEPLTPWTWKESATVLPTEPLAAWTPPDKRAKEVLTFEKGRGLNNQSKLVWRTPAQGLAKRPRLDATFTA